MSENGVHLSIGHSDATSDSVKIKGIDKDCAVADGNRCYDA